MEVALYVAQSIVCGLLIALVVVQSKGSGMSSGGSSVYTTRRGLEKTLHETTVALAVIFLLIALITSLPFFAVAIPK